MNEQLFIFYGVPILGGLLSVLFIGLALAAGRRQCLIFDLPTCKTTGVFIGLVELKGTVEAEQGLVSFLAEARCVYYHWNVAEHWSRTVTETYTDAEGKTQTRTRTESGWAAVAHGGDSITFYLQDESGIIRIQPAKATVEPKTVFERTCGCSDPLYYAKGPARAVADSTGSRSFTEQAIPLHARLYVVGQARERNDVVAPEIAYDPKAEMFLISTRSEEQISRGLVWQFWLVGFLGIALGFGGFPIRDAMLDRLSQDSAPGVLSAAFYLPWPGCWDGRAWSITASSV